MRCGHEAVVSAAPFLALPDSRDTLSRDDFWVLTIRTLHQENLLGKEVTVMYWIDVYV
ncbi:hypothetical protein GMORB2_3884 [Geosmithia morbida]|uniref:Uncharacterized protein n=1 Tax=Geosmithia morbida TaxID=1094350 RepID=A0A9P5D6R8_9HYPO|nr:uncharacterized protein GMORB2_3884 [Geosmithia morbida]KAF4125045.1 hypothetical protein GMORB2_3884 [Geosmithia morbida]